MDLIKYLPPFYFNSEEVKNIQDSIQKEDIAVKEAIKDVLNQLFVNTSTWGLNYWEKLLGIESNNYKSVEERRSSVLAKLRGQGTTTVEVIKEIAQSYADKAEVTENNSNYSFIIGLESYKGFPFILNSLYNIIEEIKPAHLECKYKLTSTTKDKIRFATLTRCAETITVYPYNPKQIEFKGTIKLALGDSTGFENITVYPRKEI